MGLKCDSIKDNQHKKANVGITVLSISLCAGCGYAECRSVQWILALRKYQTGLKMYESKKRSSLFPTPDRFQDESMPGRLGR